MILSIKFKIIGHTLVIYVYENCIRDGVLNLAATLASQPAAGHSLSFIITIVIMTLGWGLFVGLAVESYGRNLAFMPGFGFLYNSLNDSHFSSHM